MSDNAVNHREIQNIFVRTNDLLRRYHNCSFRVKILLSSSFCLCLYDVALWKVLNTGTLLKLQPCDNKCLKFFYRFIRRLVPVLLSCLLLLACQVLVLSYVTVIICLISLGLFFYGPSCLLIKVID